ncbi:zinc finger BED domain-containing protein RICESLEEPER 1-like isoform X2 [Miscanthus floridulus]|uniref:zinc finger BED domain-containing protein RICESLEEPER 1-like isoform X2 n=1 Tax=Miscanthus floridulus TaxID=154761 RepID=UPI00345A41FB
MRRRGEASPIHLLCYPSPHLESLHGTTSRLKYFPMDLVSAEFIYALKYLLPGIHDHYPLESSMGLSATTLGLSRFIHESYSSQHKRSELELYLDDPAHPEIDNDVFDIIAWWKLHGPKYPTISLMARDILSVPAYTVAFESAFSLAGLIIDDNRRSLLPETVEALMCTQDRLSSAIPDESSMAAEVIFPTATLSPTTNQQGQSVDAFLERL